MAQQGDAESMWQFSPSLGASITFLVLFFLTTAVHLGQAIYYKQKYCWVIIMSGIWQVLTYIFRTVSIQQPDSFNYYATWFILILIAPLWTNAFVYMVFGRMVWNYTDDRRVWRVKAQHFGFVFVLLDIVSFVIQVYGAAKATAKDAPTDKLRIIFRICEYAQGLDSSIPLHEAYQYSLDSLPMLLALVAFNAIHPGRIMSGSKSDLPSFRMQENRTQIGSADAAQPSHFE
ncbi:hypothetical protein THARTR1_10877 [Trichoderma harzianum]|uniref:RTA1 domain-containing protein n=1 Tax=Trichoderma harzianum TaxID=5544 RepID=A0A2K0TKA2_TRIHA|nr:hypothetical protein THARTR1_10877 [Trichoderma harzianum]